jgi:3-methyladenine DNA glycosylase AlkD
MERWGCRGDYSKLINSNKFAVVNSDLLKNLCAELDANSSATHKKSAGQFLKEGIELRGVKVGTVRAIAQKYYKQIEPRTKKNVFALCEELLKAHLQEDSIIAYQWAEVMHKELEAKDFIIFERWVKQYVRNWAQCDDVCTGALGKLLAMYPELIDKTVSWRKSKNRWVRRASAVSLIVPARTKNILRDVYAVSDSLLEDEDDLVRKGYGWLLKEVSNKYSEEIFEYVMRNKAKMPRVALRYAIEKMPKDWKKQAMEK